MPAWGIMLLAVMVAGCSSPGAKKQANRGFDYLEVEPGTPLAVPEGLAAPADSGEFVIPQVAPVDPDYVGARVDIRPPVQVMPLMAIAQVQEQGATVIATLNTAGDPIKQRQALWSGIVGYLADSGAGVSDWDVSNYQVDSGWIAAAAESDSRLGEARQLEQQYRFRIAPAAQPGRLQLIVRQLAQRSRQDGRLIEAPQALAEQRRRAKVMLNQLIVYYEEKRQQAGTDEQPRGHLTRLQFGSDDNNLPAWLADVPFVDAWREFPPLLQRLNFTVNSKDGAQGVIDTSYSGMSSRRFKALGIEPFELRESVYSFQLGDLGEATSITMFDRDGRPVSAEVMAELYPALQALLRQGGNASE